MSGPRFLTEPARLYREMRREHGGVVPIELPGGVPAWLVIGYRELHRVTGDPELFSRDSELWNQWPYIPEDWPLLPMIGHRQPSILYTVGEAHRRRHAMVSEALAGTDHIELRRRCERWADRLVDDFCGAGEAELVGDYATLLPVLVLTVLFGFPEEEGPALATALNDLVDGGEHALRGQQYLLAAMQRLVAQKKRAPGADTVSRMLARPAGFSEEELVEDLMVMVTAGHQPTADWIGNSLRLMLTDDRFAASLSGGRHSVAEAMNEVLWEDTPSQNVAGRWAARDTRLGDRHIRRGDLLVLGVAGANADPQVHNDRIATNGFTGGNSAFFSFGHGEHRCPFPAQEIAEVIARTGIEVLLDRLPDIDLAVPEQELSRRPSPWLRGMAALPVHFTPTPTAGGTG